jgi:hypothetical protein
MEGRSRRHEATLTPGQVGAGRTRTVENPRLLLTVVCRYSPPAVSFTPENRYLRTLRVSGAAAKKHTGPASGRGARARQPEGVSHETP